MIEAERTAFIDEQEQHISEMLGDRRVKLNDEALGAIRQHIDRYVARTESSSDEPGKESLNLIYSRATPFLPEIRRAFAARKVPIIIGIYLPMIESEYKPCFRNIIGATGLFQFLPGTAKRYGVAQQDMCDVNQMTPAAAHYIADLMAELGDDSQSMTLVLLSYNRGEEGVRYALRELRDHEHYERNSGPCTRIAKNWMKAFEPRMPTMFRSFLPPRSLERIPQYSAWTNRLSPRWPNLIRQANRWLLTGPLEPSIQSACYD